MNSKKKQDWLDRFEARMKQWPEAEDTGNDFGGRIGGDNNFLAAVERVMIEKKLSRGAATKFVVAEQPHLHEIWLESQNKIKKEK